MLTKEEIESEIRRLYQLRNRANAVTCDGKKIEVGMYLYEVDFCGLERYKVTEKCTFEETRMTFEECYSSADYRDLYADLELAKAEAVQRVKDNYERAKRAMEASKEAYEKIQARVEQDIKKWEGLCQN